MGHHTDVKGIAWVKNPHTTPAQVMHEEEMGVERPGQMPVGKNLTTALGGFARFYGTELQNKVVQRFITVYERAQLGGARACDPQVEPVDGGGLNPEHTALLGIDARRALGKVQDHLGRVDFKRLELVTIGGKGPTSYATWRTGARKPNARVISQMKVEVRTIVLKLAILWGEAGSVAGRKDLAAWDDGSEQFVSGNVVRPRAVA